MKRIAFILVSCFWPFLAQAGDLGLDCSVKNSAGLFDDTSAANRTLANAFGSNVSYGNNEEGNSGITEGVLPEEEPEN